MKVLITGANGFIGSHLVESCLQAGWETACLVRGTSDLTFLEGLDVEFVRGDISDPESLGGAVSGRDVIFHLAGRTKARSLDDFMKANARGVANLLEVAARSAPNLARFLHTSSQAAAGPSPSMKPIDESATPRPLTWYGKSKLASERECEKFYDKLPVTVVRPPSVYGPRERDIYDFFRVVNYGIKPYLGDHEKYISIIHARDLARGMILAARSEKSVGKTYFLANPVPVSFSSLVNALALSLGRDGLRVRIPHDLVKQAARISEFFGRISGKLVPFNTQKAVELCQRYWTCDPSAAKRDFGFETEIDLLDGFRDTAEWYRSEGWL